MPGRIPWPRLSICFLPFALSTVSIIRDRIIWGSPKSKNVNYKVEHPIFQSDEKGRPNISYIDQFPEPKNMEQGNFLQR